MTAAGLISPYQTRALFADTGIEWYTTLSRDLGYIDVRAKIKHIGMRRRHKLWPVISLVVGAHTPVHNT